MNKINHKILFVLAAVSRGGTERFFSNLLQAWPTNDDEIHLALWREEIDYPLPDTLHQHLLHKYKPWDLPGVIQRTCSLVKTLQPDVVISGHYFTNLVTGEAMRPFSRTIPWICRFGNPPEIELQGWKSLWAKRVLPTASFVIGNSQGVCKSLQRHFNIKADRTRHIPNLVTLPEQTNQSDLSEHTTEATFTFLNVGRLHPQKNQKLLLHAFSRLKHDKTRLVILGEGPARHMLEKEIQKLGLTDSVTLPGFNTDISSAYQHADCFVLTSNWEGSPNSLIEAMVAGLPVISTDCPYGPSELITHAQNGLIIPVNDEDALLEAMQNMIASPEQRHHMATQAEQTIRTQFNKTEVLKHFSDTIDKAIKTTS